MAITNTSAEIPPEAEIPKLSGRMGSTSLMLTVLAFAAPIAVVTGFIPLTIIFSGPGAVASLIATTLLLLLFAVGFVAMTKTVRRPGAFYSYASVGLGKVSGLGSAFLAAASYFLILVGAYVFVGILITDAISHFAGLVTPWYLWAFVVWLLISTLGYLHIDLSAKVLVIVMSVEVLLILIFVVAVLVQGGAEGLSFYPFTPSAFLAGNFPVTMLFGVLMFLGFEATAVFRDEVKNPTRTIPRATYGAVLFVGILQTLSTYALYSSYGSKAVEVASADPTTMFPNAISTFVAPIFGPIVIIMVTVSQLASLIPVHNVTTRYFFNLAADGALPKYLSGVHGKHKSPYRASIAVSLMALLAALPFVLTQSDGVVVYSQLFGIGTVGLMWLMAIVSLAVIIWFARKGRPAGISVIQAFVAPAIACALLLSISIFAVIRYDLVVGGAPGQNTGLLLILVGGLIAGVTIAIYFKKKRPDRYAELGGEQREDREPIPIEH